MIALFVISVTFFTTLAVVQNIRDAREEKASRTEAVVNQTLQSDASGL